MEFPPIVWAAEHRIPSSYPQTAYGYVSHHGIQIDMESASLLSYSRPWASRIPLDALKLYLDRLIH